MECGERVLLSVVSYFKVPQVSKMRSILLSTETG